MVRKIGPEFHYRPARNPREGETEEVFPFDFSIVLIKAKRGLSWPSEKYHDESKENAPGGPCRVNAKPLYNIVNFSLDSI